MSDALDAFLAHYFARRPVNATFTGVHAHDHALPDWSAAGLAALDDEMRALGAALAAAHPPSGDAAAYRADPDLLDAVLARAFLDVQRDELAAAHGPRGNPALWTGEAVFGVVALMIRDFAPLAERVASATARLAAVPAFLAQARATLGARPVPVPWAMRALRDCEGADRLLDDGVRRWTTSGPLDAEAVGRLHDAADAARAEFAAFADWLRAAAPGWPRGCGAAAFERVLRRGHFCARAPAELLREARAALAEARVALDAAARAAGGTWPEVQERLAADHPAPEDYLPAFARRWEACRARAAAHDVVTWPDWPIRYVPFPAWTADAAPYLYYLYYRSPAPLDPEGVHEYVVPPLPAGDPTPHLRVWNHAAITLNHVVHHGAVGHHVQNWHAYHRARSRIGRIAAVDCASRIGMFGGGTMAEGWACYATGLMEELGFLSPLERASEQHSRVRQLVRAVVDVAFHTGEMSFGAAVRFWTEQAGTSRAVAWSEVTKCSMFPGTAIMYWLGTEGILDVRAERRRRDGDRFTLRAFHDELLGYGSIPVPLAAWLMTGAET